MPVITKLKSQKNSERVNIFFDHKFAFGLNLQEVVKRGLKIGQNFSEIEIERLLDIGLFEKLYFKTLNFLKFRPRSQREISYFLKRNFYKLSTTNIKLQENIRQKIIKKLKAKNLIDDYKFALWWVEQRLTFKPKGKQFLKAELFNKGINKEIINEILANISNQQFVKLAKQIINKKIKTYQKLFPFELKKKLYSHLARRGFDFETIKKAIDESNDK